MSALAVGYTAECGVGDRRAWDELLESFVDANLYQSWSYDRVRDPRWRTCQVIVRRNGAAVAAAQVRMARLPGMRTGVAYVRWGPMWRRRRIGADVDTFRQAVRAIRNEFSRRLGLLVRLYPLAFQGHDDVLRTVLEEEGYRLHGTGKRERTLIVDLDGALDRLRAGLDQKWRNCLNRAERNGLEVTLGEDDHLFGAISEMHDQMARRKGLDGPNDVGQLRAIQKDLPEPLRLKVAVASRRGELCAGAIVSGIGATGLYVKGATSDVGLGSNGSYVVQWALVRWLKEHGFARYDLNGISPEVNPGTYHFKRGLAGRYGIDVEFLGRFQVADNALSGWAIGAGERLRAGYRRLVGTGR